MTEENINEEKELNSENPVEAQDATTEVPQEVSAENSNEEATETGATEAAAETETVSENEQPAAEKTTNNEPAEFDWSMDKEGFTNYTDSERKKLEALYTDTVKPLEEGTIVSGKVVSMTKKDVVLNVGYKSDGLVSRTEFRDTPDLAVGDEVEVFVESTEDALGQLILSRKKAIAEGAWDKIVHAKEHNEILKGYVKTRTKGGLVVDLLGMDAFLPGSQIDVKPIRDYDQYVGQTMEFKVVKINETFKNVVISHKALIEDDIEAQKSEILANIEKGQVLEGVVKNMTNFGVFVDLGGLDGLLHITDISWGRINHPEEVLELDQKINVVVLDFDDDKKRISLGMKQLTSHPWDALPEELKEGARVKGKVVNVSDYGAFIEIQSGIEGLIHVSEMSWSQHLRNPQDFLKVGDEVEAVILSLDKEEHKMSLGLKQLTPDPWENIQVKYEVGSKHKGIVRNLTNYGLFVELEEGVDGLVHVSDLSWSKKIKHPAEFTKKGEELEVVVLEIDRDNRRLSLGHKQLDENPWDTFESIFHEGSEHSGTIIEVNDKGATVAMPYGVEAFAPTKHLKKQDKTPVKADEELTFRVIEFNKDAKRIIVSHTDLWKEAEREQGEEEDRQRAKRQARTTKNVKRINQQVERSTLGEIDALSELKAMFEDTSADEAPAAAPPKKSKTEAKKVEEPETEETSSEESAAAEGASDDLKKIGGVGPAFEKRLNALGINSYADLANLSDSKIEELEQQDSMTSLEQWHKWIEEAKSLMS